MAETDGGPRRRIDPRRSIARSDVHDGERDPLCDSGLATAEERERTEGERRGPEHGEARRYYESPSPREMIQRAALNGGLGGVGAGAGTAMTCLSSWTCGSSRATC
jgi:hypothetical protein